MFAKFMYSSWLSCNSYFVVHMVQSPIIYHMCVSSATFSINHSESHSRALYEYIRWFSKQLYIVWTRVLKMVKKWSLYKLRLYWIIWLFWNRVHNIIVLAAKALQLLNIYTKTILYLKVHIPIKGIFKNTSFYFSFI